MIVIGLDPSTSNTGVVVMESLNRELPPKVAAYYQCKPKTKWSRYEKQAWLLDRIDTITSEHHPDLIVIEGYGMNLKNPSAIIPLVELGGILRFFMHANEYPYLSPEPAVWKQFLLGPKQGNAKKDVIMAYVTAKFGHKWGTDDLYDAFALALCGMAYKNLVPGLTAFQREKLGEIVMR